MEKHLLFLKQKMWEDEMELILENSELKDRVEQAENQLKKMKKISAAREYEDEQQKQMIRELIEEKKKKKKKSKH